MVAERRRLLDEGLIDAWMAALFDRRRLMFEAEIRWLERPLSRDGD